MAPSRESLSESSTVAFDTSERLLQQEKDMSFDDYVPRPREKLPAIRDRWSLIVVGIIAVTSLCSNLALVLIAMEKSPVSKFGSFEDGFSTDMEPAKPVLEALRKPFTGELKRHPNGTMYRDMPGPQYFGEPNPEIDKNWADLVYASGIDLGEDEITTAGLKDTTWQEPQGGLWRTGLDVFHQLHCVNMVRKSFYPEYYEEAKDSNIDDPPRLRNMHRDHCLDYIRQAIMCNSDITPVRLQWDYESHFLIPKFDQRHTCRNFESLHAWSRERALEKYHDESTRLIDKMRDAGIL